MLLAFIAVATAIPSITNKEPVVGEKPQAAIEEGEPSEVSSAVIVHFL